MRNFIQLQNMSGGNVFELLYHMSFPFAQTCSEMVMPIGFGTSPDSMFPPQTFNLNEFINECKSFYGVLPQPHWVTTYYGGQVCS